MQAIDRTAPILPIMPARMTHNYDAPFRKPTQPTDIDPCRYHQATPVRPDLTPDDSDRCLFVPTVSHAELLSLTRSAGPQHGVTGCSFVRPARSRRHEARQHGTWSTPRGS
jgi:hypothetical protein